MDSVLVLATAGEKCITIMTFGATQVGKRICEHVKVGFKLKCGQTFFDTFSVPTICEPLTCHPLVNCRDVYPHLSGLEFADEPEDGQEVIVDSLWGRTTTGISSLGEYSEGQMDLLQSTRGSHFHPY